MKYMLLSVVCDCIIHMDNCILNTFKFYLKNNKIIVIMFGQLFLERDYDKVSAQGRFTPPDIVDAAISFITRSFSFEHALTTLCKLCIVCR